MSPDSPIVVLDSGLGGLTVVRALRNVLRHEDIVYFGDTARLPYGSKTADTVATFVKQIIGYLKSVQPKHVVIACNTATALALPEVRRAFPELSISGVIEPGAKAAAVAAGPKHAPIIGVIATEATIRSKEYERAIHRRRAYAQLMVRATPLLVPIIEEGRSLDDPIVKLALKQYLRSMMEHKIDVLVLGCTHYPIIKDAIQATVGAQVRVIDSAEECAEDVARRLISIGTLRPGLDERVGSLRCFVTDDPTRFARLGSGFLGVTIDEPTLVSPDDLYGIPQALPPAARRAG